MSESGLESDRPDGREMAAVHHVFRRSLTEMPAFIGAARAGDAARVRQLAEHLGMVLDALHHHHSGEDELIWPLLLDRVPLQATLVAAMQSQHAAVADGVERARQLTDQWGHTADPALGTQLTRTLTELSAPLFAHLDEEEARLVPIICNHLSAEEWDQLRRQAINNLGPERSPLFLGMMLESMSGRHRAEFFARMPAPAPQAWADGGQSRFDDYIGGVRAGRPA